MSKTDRNTSDKRQIIVVAGALAILTFAVFCQVVRFSFIQFDDPTYVFANPHVLQGITPASIKWAFTGIHGANWHPLTSLTHLLEAQFLGRRPAGYHFVSLAFHILNVL